MKSEFLKCGRTAPSLAASLLLGISVFTALAGAAESPKRGMIPADFLAMETVSDPHLSPDGRMVAYSMATIDAKSGRRTSNIWMVPADGSRAAWQFTTAQSSTRPRWTSDGKSLAFISARPDPAAPAAAARPQVFLLQMTGGEAQRLTDLPNGVTDFEVSPDGKQLACVSKSGGVKTSPDYRHYGSAFYKFDGSGWFDDKKSHIWIVDVSTHAMHQITSGDATEDTEPQWSPDGSKLAFIAQDTGTYRGLGAAVMVVGTAGGTATRVSDQEGAAHAPRWSEDGKRIAYIASPNDADDAKIWITSSDRRESRVASKSLDIIPADLDWIEGGKALLFSAQAKGEQQLFRLAIDSGAITALTAGSNFIQGQDLNEAANRLVYVQGDAAHLGDIYSADRTGHGARPLTKANQKLYSSVTFQDAERIRYPAVDDFPVEAFFMKPIGWQAGQKYPMILCIHGGPGGMWAARFYHEFQMYAARGYAVLYINPRGSSGYGEKFQRAVEKNWGGKTYDDLMRGVDYALQKYPWVDRERLGVVGGSFGGFMTNWIVGHTNRFKAAVTLSSISNFTSLEGTRDMAYSHAKDFGGDLFDNFDFYWNQSPLKYAKSVKTPTLIIHGEADHRVPVEQGEQWFRALRHFGVASEMIIFPGENHSYAANPKHRVDISNWEIYWFERYLNGNKAVPAPDAP